MKIKEAQNMHHIFTYYEVREKIIEIFGEPHTDVEHKLIQQETDWAWKKMPKYKLPVNKHNLIHIEQLEKNRRRGFKSVMAGFKSMVKQSEKE